MSTVRKTHRTVRGADVNMETIRNANADTIALGNARMNARGDVLDGQGQVLVRRDQIIQQYHRNAETNVRQVSLKQSIANAETPAQVIARLEKEINAKKALVDQPVQSQPNNNAVINKNRARKLLDKSE
jgi:hypothetical protein